MNKPDASIINIKKKIISSYCSSVSVIDDDAYIEESWFDNTLQVSNEYSPLVKKCQEDSILCHLHQYPKGEGDPEDDIFKDAFQSAVSIAKKSDIVILDWYLGNEDTSEHALSLLNELDNVNGFKIVLVYTKHPESPGAELESTGFEPVDTGNENEFSTESLYTKNQKLFVYIIPKSEVNGISSGELISRFYSVFNYSFPGLLQWAGLQIGSSIREQIPAVIEKLPRYVDTELALQVFFKEMENELAGQMAGLFILDLSKQIMNNPPEIIHDENLLSHLSEQSPEFMIDLNGNKADTGNKIKKLARKISYDQLGIKEASLIDLNGFIESITKINNSEEPVLEQGTVIDCENHLYLCITPLCDLYRMKPGSYVSFLVGIQIEKLEKTSEQNYIQTVVRTTNNKSRIISWDITDFHQVEISRTRKGFPIVGRDEFKKYSYVGSIRDDVFQRILQRTWSWRSRIGIDPHEIVRIIRDEK